MHSGLSTPTCPKNVTYQILPSHEVEAMLLDDPLRFEASGAGTTPRVAHRSAAQNSVSYLHLGRMQPVSLMELLILIGFHIC